MTDPQSGSLAPEDESARRRRLVDRIFDAALDVPASERGALLDERCPTELRADVERLLAAAGETGDADAETFLREGGALLGAFGSRLADLMDEDAPLMAGDAVGPYRVAREIGRGGMAAVYLAERADGVFEQKVALKVTLNRHQGPRSRARFELERQILAGLRHPNIAQLLDGGVTEAGHPYFVMEWVDGQNIDHYCDAERLTVEERLRLFVDVGRAVETAHRSLIVHRDLKPGNVLVTTDPGDGSRRVKLLDFGIAKVLDDGEGASAFGGGLTRTALPMTPDYASPEQLLGAPLTTAVDVYQLGLLLFELLCGQHPFGGMSLVERVARDHTPTRPSLLLQTDEAGEIAARRSTDPAALRRRIAGDLETIVMTALRTEPERRYSTAKALVDDVVAFLEDRPIQARGDSLIYRARKFVARNLGATLATALSVLVLVAVITLSMVRLRQERDAAETARREAEQARAEAEQVAAFLTDLFETSEGGAVRAESLSALDLLEAGKAKVHEDLDESPALRARMLEVLARVHKEMTLYEEALDLARESLEIREEVFGPDSLPVASSLEIVALSLIQTGRRNEAVPLQERSLEIRRRHLSPGDVQMADSLESLATAYWYQGRYQDVEPLVRQALAIRQADEPEGVDDPDTVSLHVKMSILLRTLERYDEAGVHAERALDIARRTWGPRHSQVAAAMNVLALNHMYQGQYEQAEALYRQAIDTWSDSVGGDSSLVTDAMLNLGSVYLRMHRLEDAAAVQADAVELRESTLGPDHPRTALALNNLANSLRRLGRLDEAESRYRRALEIFESTGQPDHPDAAWALNGLGELLTELGRFDEAEERIRRGLEIRRAAYNEDNTETAKSFLALARLHHAAGRPAEAEPFYRKTLEIWTTSAETSRLEEIVAAYGEFLKEQGRQDEADALRDLLAAPDDPS